MNSKSVIQGNTLITSTPRMKSPNVRESLEQSSFGLMSLSDSFKILPQVEVKPLPKARRPKMLDLICQAIEAIGSPRNGASYMDIKDWIVGNSEIDMTDGRLAAAMKRALEAGLKREVLGRANNYKDSVGLKGWFVVVKKNSSKNEKLKVSRTYKGPKIDVDKIKKIKEKSAPDTEVVNHTTTDSNGYVFSDTMIVEGKRKNPIRKVANSKDGTKSAPNVAKTKVAASSIPKLAKPRTETESDLRTAIAKKAVTVPNTEEPLCEVGEEQSVPIVAKFKVKAKTAPRRTRAQKVVTEPSSEVGTTEIAIVVAKSKVEAKIASKRKKPPNVATTVPGTESSSEVGTTEIATTVAESKVETKTASKRTRTQKVVTDSKTTEPSTEVGATDIAATVEKSEVESKIASKGTRTQKVVTFPETKSSNEAGTTEIATTVPISNVEGKRASKRTKIQNIVTFSETAEPSSKVEMVKRASKVTKSKVGAKSNPKIAKSRTKIESATRGSITKEGVTPSNPEEPLSEIESATSVSTAAKYKAETKAAPKRTRVQKIVTVTEATEPTNELGATKIAITEEKSKVQAKIASKRIKAPNVVTVPETTEPSSEVGVAKIASTIGNKRTKVQNVATISKMEPSSNKPKQDLPKPKKAKPQVKRDNSKVLHKGIRATERNKTSAKLPRKDLSDTELDVKRLGRKSLKSYSSDTDINKIDPNDTNWD